MFTFIQTIEGVDFKGALKILAEKAGVELVKEDPQKRSERDALYASLEAATKFYEEELPSAQNALAYLEKRGVNDKTKKLWRIGFAPEAWRDTKDALNNQKFTDSQLMKAGLIKGEAGKQPYDVFRNRIMFPIADTSGRVVGFSGRTMSNEPETPKYVNSPDTELYNKSEILFGYDKAKQGIRHYDFSLIVEGQFDVVLAHQAGYHNAVAVSGTALTLHHVDLLQRLSNRVVLALDADRAGLAAVKRATDFMLPRGMDVKVARLPDGKDPADMVLEDAAQFKHYIGHAVHVIEHLLAVVKGSAKDERHHKILVREEVLPRVLLIPSPLEQEHFADVVAKDIGASKEGVMLELSMLKERQTSRPAEVPVVANTSVSDDAPKTNDRLGELQVFVAVLATIIEPEEASKVGDIFARIVGVTPTQFLATTETSLKSKFIFEAGNELEQLNKSLRAAFLLDRVRELQQLHWRTKATELRQIIIASETAGNTAETERLLAELQKVHQEQQQVINF